jgi:serine/threonine-protein kinase
MTPDGCATEGVLYPRAWCVGLAARTRGDSETAVKAFHEARAEAERIVREQPDYAEALCVLGMIDAALGRKEDAISEGKRAVTLLPVEQDSIDGAVLIESLAMIYAWTGEKDLAIAQLESAIKIPGQLSYGQLRLHPNWDPLRGDPRFEQIIAALAPNERSQ